MSKRFNVLTVGDAMITMNPTTQGPLRYVTQFERKVGGAELNFAIGCARLGLYPRWVSRVGADEFGRVIYNFARGEGVDMSQVRFVEGYPTSINFKEIQEDGSGKTFYYRYNSPILTLTQADITDNLFKDIHLLHVTGVFLAIDRKNREFTLAMVKRAKELGIPVSFDPNIRLKLWTIEEAREVFNLLFPYVDVLLTGLDEIRLILEKESDADFEQLAQKYEITHLVIKDGGNGSKLYCNGQWTNAPGYKVSVVDTVGAGDGFDAGYVYGYLHGYGPDKLLRFANGVGALVTTVSGDNEGLPYLDEVNRFILKKSVIER